MFNNYIKNNTIITEWADPMTNEVVPNYFRDKHEIKKNAAEMDEAALPLDHSGEVDGTDEYSLLLDPKMLMDIMYSLCNSEKITDNEMGRHILGGHFVSAIAVAEDHFEAFKARINPEYRWNEIDRHLVDGHELRGLSSSCRVILIFIPDKYLPQGTMESCVDGFDINLVEYARLGFVKEAPSPLYS